MCQEGEQVMKDGKVGTGLCAQVAVCDRKRMILNINHTVKRDT